VVLVVSHMNNMSPYSIFWCWLEARHQEKKYRKKKEDWKWCTLYSQWSI